MDALTLHGMVFRGLFKVDIVHMAQFFSPHGIGPTLHSSRYISFRVQNFNSLILA